MNILYKCKCMLAEAEVECPERFEDEDVLDWMRLCVEPAIYMDHRRRSPGCQSSTMEYAKIPAPENAPFLGAAPKLDS